jgi:hypothetical protein
MTFVIDSWTFIQIYHLLISKATSIRICQTREIEPFQKLHKSITLPNYQTTGTFPTSTAATIQMPSPTPALTVPADPVGLNVANAEVVGDGILRVVEDVVEVFVVSV